MQSYMASNEATPQTQPEELQQEIDAINGAIQDTAVQNQQAGEITAQQVSLQNESTVAWQQQLTTDDIIEPGYKLPVRVPQVQGRHDVLRFTILGNVELMIPNKA